MQVTYYNIDRTVLTQRKSKIVDLAAYRRQLEEKACKTYEEEWEEPIPAASESSAVLGSGQVQMDRHLWLLDICASLGVAVMTFSFALHVLFG